MVERLTRHESRRATRGGANTTGTVTIEKPTLAGVVETHRARLHESSIPPGWHMWGERRSGGVRAAVSCSMTLVSREALDHRLFSPTASGVALCLPCLRNVDTYFLDAV